MMIKITQNQDAHRFNLEIDQKCCVLSYKGFSGGKKAVETLDFSLILQKLNTAVINEDLDAIQAFFNLTGPENAVRLIAVVCPDQFKKIWSATANKHRSLYGVCSFRKVLGALSGSNATLNHSSGWYVTELKQLCDQVNNAQPNNNFHVEHDSASRDGVSIALVRCGNNANTYCLNGSDVTLCPRIATASVGDLLNVVLSIRATVIEQGDLHPLIDTYGAQFCMRVLLVLCEEETLRYFDAVCEQILKTRMQLFPRKILKSYGFDIADDAALSIFRDRILSFLEEKAVNSIDRLISGNDYEIFNASDRWNLYMCDGPNCRRITIRFDTIMGETLRNEICNFLRDECRDKISYNQLYRHYNHLHKAADAITDEQVVSILDFDVSRALILKEKLLAAFQENSKKTRYPLDSVQECFGVLKRFYFWALTFYGSNYKIVNPFSHVLFPNARNLSSAVAPSEQDDLQIIHDHSDELPESIALAFELMLLTLARAYDVFHLRVSNFDLTANTLRFISSKRKRPIFRQVPGVLAARIKSYIKSTEQLREITGTDYLLLHTPSGRREKSSLKPMLITPKIYNDHISTLLKNHECSGAVTSRGIRAEGGRREAMRGASTMDRAIQLGNTPAVADRHYNSSITRSQLLEKANLLHKHFSVIFSDISDESPTVKVNAPVHVFWGTCNADNCILRNDCETCPMAFQKK